MVLRTNGFCADKHSLWPGGGSTSSVEEGQEGGDGAGDAFAPVDGKKMAPAARGPSGPDS